MTALPQIGPPHPVDQAYQVVIARHVAAAMESGAAAEGAQAQAREAPFRAFSARGTRSMLSRIGGAVSRGMYQMLRAWSMTRSGACPQDAERFNFNCVAFITRPDIAWCGSDEDVADSEESSDDQSRLIGPGPHRQQQVRISDCAHSNLHPNLTSGPAADSRSSMASAACEAHR